MNRLHQLLVFALFAVVFTTMPAQAQIRVAPVTAIGDTVTCHIGANSFQYQPDHRLISAQSWTGKAVEAQAIFNKVSDYTSLRTIVYTVPVTDKKVNVEICPGDRNYIVYNADWVKALYEETNSLWVLYAVMAHEIGHYVRGHQHTQLGSTPEIELEADEYAGEVLAKMGASLQDAQAAFRSGTMRPRSHTHPPINKRLKAVESGWSKTFETGWTKSGERNIGSKTFTRDSRTTAIGGTGFIPGLEGRLNPILDEGNRTYLYANNIAIEGGQNQPVTFSLNQPLLVEDSLGNQFQLKISSIGNDGTTIEYSQLASAADKELATLNLRIVDQNSRPVPGAEVYVIFSDGTHLRGTTDSSGTAKIQRLKQRIVTIFCAHPNYKAFNRQQHDVASSVVIGLAEHKNTGSIIINRTGYLKGFDGRLSPMLDSSNRMYLYAQGSSIENGRTQPVDFTLNQPIQVDDKKGNRFELRVIAIIASLSLIEFVRLN